MATKTTRGDLGAEEADLALVPSHAAHARTTPAQLVPVDGPASRTALCPAPRPP